MIKEYDILGETFVFEDHDGSIAMDHVVKDQLIDNYRLHEIKFNRGDIVVDLGANIGIFASCLGRKHPDITIYSIEAVPQTYKYLLQNLWRNNITNVVPVLLAVTGGRQEAVIWTRLNANTGGSSGVILDVEGGVFYKVPGANLDTVFNMFRIEKCKLLKIDIEGMEYEVLYNFSMLDRVEHMRAEFHMNGNLHRQGYDRDHLAAYCSNKTKLWWEWCNMSE